MRLPLRLPGACGSLLLFKLSKKPMRDRSAVTSAVVGALIALLLVLLAPVCSLLRGA